MAESASPFLGEALLASLMGQARSLPRRRAHHPLHRGNDALAHRILVAMEPDSYVRPHRHLDPHKAETIIVLRGCLGTLIFDEEGQVLERQIMAPGAAVFGYDIQPGVFHSIVALASGSVFLEAKAGPYQVPAAAEWAPWAPAEGMPGVPEYLDRLRTCLL
ncbi:WbuC family cupin fold metalloprotein [Zoogloea sp.]|uniref:WbuC family cupin fold metalloprotein n=1 Tax=Zoogloea sp. TaxID=49181 RepID=UPI002626AEAC|nr:WbuC family cupin fold metalloprotein [Zoogloea sp.]MDD3354200.1 WbuC family cupin fold metalloprotein [Zoogloea sp.]